MKNLVFEPIYTHMFENTYIKYKENICIYIYMFI